jgi:hypothetical protein
MERLLRIIFDLKADLRHITDRKSLLKFASDPEAVRKLPGDEVIDKGGNDQKYIKSDDRCPKDRQIPRQRQRHEPDGKQDVESA